MLPSLMSYLYSLVNPMRLYVRNWGATPAKRSVRGNIQGTKELNDWGVPQSAPAS